ncbi:hypothetical protein C8R43DRAFT_959565 [Mycena crocata]|nr:hypothetical protein C8R43DRAFT_959565 [Mycena crocata]
MPFDSGITKFQYTSPDSALNGLAIVRGSCQDKMVPSRWRYDMISFLPDFPADVIADLQLKCVPKKLRVNRIAPNRTYRSMGTYARIHSENGRSRKHGGESHWLTWIPTRHNPISVVRAFGWTMLVPTELLDYRKGSVHGSSQARQSSAGSPDMQGRQTQREAHRRAIRQPSLLSKIIVRRADYLCLCDFWRMRYRHDEGGRRFSPRQHMLHQHFFEHRCWFSVVHPDDTVGATAPPPIGTTHRFEKGEHRSMPVLFGLDSPRRSLPVICGTFNQGGPRLCRLKYFCLCSRH